MRDLRQSPAVAWRLFRANLQTRYRRAWLGYAWLLLPTIGTTVLWVHMRSRNIVEIDVPGVAYPVYVLSGMILWQAFLDAMNAPLQQWTASRQIVTRSRVPLEALLMAGMLETLVNCFVRVLLLVPVLILYGVTPRPEAGLALLGLAALLLFGLTLGVALAPAGMLFEDVGRAVLLLSGFWFFLTPVLYPARGIMHANPLTPLIDSTRSALTGGPFDPRFAVVAALTVPVLIAAWLFSRLSRPHVIARLG
jgi:lipopolysaccharide transport system permease protein